MPLNRKTKIALGASLFGGFFVVLSLMVLNHIDRSIRSTPKSVTDFSSLKKKKSPVKKTRKRKRRKKTVVKKMKPVLDMKLANSGVDLGIDVLGLGLKDSELLSGGNEALTADVVDKPPMISHREALVYPQKALREKVNGFVTLSLLVERDGRVGSMKIVDSQPMGLFDQSALNAVREWVFEPAEFKGQQVAVWMKQKIQFRLN